MNLVTLTYGPALQAIWAKNSYALTVARTTFARAHSIAPAEVVVTIGDSDGPFDRTPTARELITINAV